MRYAVLLFCFGIAAGGCKKTTAVSGPKPKLEVYAVDDDDAPFAGATLKAPMQLESEMVGRGAGMHRADYILFPLGPLDDPRVTERALRRELAGYALPSGTRLVYGYVPNGTPGVRAWLVRGAPVLTERDVESATATEDPDTHHFSIMVKLTATGASAFEAFTAASVGARAAIVVDDVVQSVPVIQSKIGGGRIQITMGGGKSPAEEAAEAHRLADGFGGP